MQGQKRAITYLCLVRLKIILVKHGKCAHSVFVNKNPHAARMHFSRKWSPVDYHFCLNPSAEREQKAL